MSSPTHTNRGPTLLGIDGFGYRSAQKSGKETEATDIDVVSGLTASIDRADPGSVTTLRYRWENKREESSATVFRGSPSTSGDSLRESSPRESSPPSSAPPRGSSSSASGASFKFTGDDDGLAPRTKLTPTPRKLRPTVPPEGESGSSEGEVEEDGEEGAFLGAGLVYEEEGEGGESDGEGEEDASDVSDLFATLGQSESAGLNVKRGQKEDGEGVKEGKGKGKDAKDTFTSRRERDLELLNAVGKCGCGGCLLA